MTINENNSIFMLDSNSPTSFTKALIETAQSMSGWEVIAVILAIAYLLLAMKESLWCWYAAFISTAIYLFLFWDVSLLMESGLQVYYLVMAVYGWYQWKFGAADHHGVHIHNWSLHQHVVAIGGILIASLVSGFLLANNSSAAWPYVDSFTTWGSILTTWMVTRKILENWLYWLVIDSVSILLYFDRELYLTALLFAVYLVICVFGFFNWQRQWREQQPVPSIST